MAFDLKTARPVEDAGGGFDLSTATEAPTPTASSVLPNVAPQQQAGLAPRGQGGVGPGGARLGAGAVPGGEAPRAAPLPEPTIRERVLGAVEAGIEVLTQVAGFPVTQLAGENRDAQVRMQAGARQGLRYNPITGPVMAGLEQMGIGQGPTPMNPQGTMSPAGVEATEAVGGVMENLPPFLGHIGPMAGVSVGLQRPGAGADAAAGLRRSVGEVRDAVKRAPIEEPIPAGSAGAMGVDVPTQRTERASSLPVPIELTKGQRERSFEQQRFERETAKNPDLGKPLRDRYAEQNRQLQENLADFVDQTGAKDLDPNAVGRGVTEAINKKAEKAKAEVKQAYDEAKLAGEADEPVPYAPIQQLIDEQTPTTREQIAPVLKVVQEQLAKNDPEATGSISLNALEDVRKVVRQSIEPGTPNAKFGTDLIERIDAAMDGGTGALYRKARGLHREYAAEFKNQLLVRDLIGLKKNSSDRKIALADVFDRSVLGASLEDLQKVKRTLNTGGEAGRQAWNDLRGRTIEWIKEQATSNVTRDEWGNPVVSAAKLDRAITKLDADGRLEELFGKKGAEQLRDVNDIAKDVFTAPPGAVNTSGTASVLIQAIDTLGTYMLSGGTVPLPAMTLLKKGIQNLKERKLKGKVRYALGPGGERKGSPVRAFEPGNEPPAPPGPGAPPKPPAPPPAGAAPTPQATLPGVEPAPVARETSQGRGATKRERELVTLRDQATDPQVLKDLDGEIAAERRRAADERRATEYRKLAEQTADAELKAKFTAKADKLAPAAAKADAEVETIPVPEVRELAEADLDPGVDMIKVRAEGEAAWRREQRVGDLDAERMKATWQAMQYDAAAVERAAQQHENSPRAFDREVQRIIDEGKQRADEGEQDPGGREGLGRRAEAGRGQAGTGSQRPRSDGDAAPRAERPAQDTPGRQAQGLTEPPTRRREAAARREFESATEPTGNEITDRLSAKLRDDYDAAVREYGERPDAKGGVVLNTDTARELSPDYLADRTRSADVHEPASAFIKRVYAQKLAQPTPAGKDRVVLFTAGGTGAGKTTGLNLLGKQLGSPEIVYDTNMNGLQSAVDKIDAALDAGRDVRILYVYADPVDAFYQAMSRTQNQKARHGTGRTVPIAEHVKTHVGASQVMRQLAERYKDDLRVELVGVDNSLGKGNARAAPIPKLPEVRDNGLREVLQQIADQALERGDLDADSHAGFSGSREAVRHEGVGRVLRQGLQRRGDEGAQPDPGAQEGLGPLPAAPANLGAVGADTSVITERGLRVPVRYRLADVADLVTSHSDDLKVNPAFDQRLQPRDRSRMSSEAQITKIENGLQPELLADSPKASDGAPIVGADGIVESGNARTIALRRAYAGGKADGYRAWLEQNAARFGLKPEDVKSRKAPVLVRERTGELDRADFARQANESPVSSMSETEQAKSDAAKLPDLEGLVTSDTGEIQTGGSAEFIRQFMRYVASPNEHNQLMTGDGRLSQRGANRIRNAIFAKAYGDSDIVAMLTEATDGNVRNLLAGMLRAAPEVARLRTLLEAGARSGRDFAPDLVDAVRRYSAAREAGQKVEQYLGQSSMFGGEMSPAVADLMRALERDSRAPTRIADMVRGLVDEIDRRGDPRQSGLF